MARGKMKQTLYVTKEVIKLIWQTSKPYTIYTIFLLTAYSLVPIAEAYFIKRIIDLLTLSLSSTVEFNAILFFVGLFIAVTLISRLLESQRNATQIVLGNLFGKYILQRIVDKTTKLAFWRFENPDFHDKLDRVRDQAAWKPLNTFYHLFDAVQSAISLVAVFIVLTALSPWLVLLMVLFALPALIVQVKFGTAWWNLLFEETSRSRKLQYYQHLMTSSHEMKDLKLLNLRSVFLRKYKVLYDNLFNEQKTLTLKRYWWDFFTYLISDVILVLFYVFLAWRTFMQTITIGDFTFFSMMYNRGIQSLHYMVRDIAGVYENNLFIKEMLDFFALEEESVKTDTHVPRKIKKGFEFKDVWFKYPGTKLWILKGVSFTIPVTKNIALVGENGAGKTTIVKLLTRLYEPTKGQILLDGVPIEKYDLTEYRSLFGIAFQDFAKFRIPARDNIKYGDLNRHVSDAEMMASAKKAQIHKKIMSLPRKYKTILGRWFHEGHEISHGEWQRLAIARALVRKAPAYILDEPTAALDAKAEYEVFEQFRKQVKGKTAMFISHRFSNVKLASEIIVLEHGKIIQRGTHKELMRKRGMYRQLYNFQAKKYRES